MENQSKYLKPNWDEYFLEIVTAVALRAGCDRGRSGCVITQGNRIVATGYVGAPEGLQDCYEAGHEFITVMDEAGHQRQHCIRTIHAEQNAIAQAAKFGISLQGSTLYCSMLPCFNCAKLVVASGIARVVAKNMYHAGKSTLELFKKANISLTLLSQDMPPYSN